jgi:hypothetical protein
MRALIRLHASDRTPLPQETQGVRGPHVKFVALLPSARAADSRSVTDVAYTWLHHWLFEPVDSGLGSGVYASPTPERGERE